MTKQSIHFCFIFSIYLLVSLSFLSSAIADPVNIPDPALRDAVEDALGKTAGDTITQAEMGAGDFTFLFGNDMGISDLTGLEYATNLQTVYLDRNSISDLTPLSGLTRLEQLHFIDNQISDISPLSNITALQSLHLEYNNLTSLDGLPDLSSTYALHFDYNQITNIEALVNHTELTGDVYVNLEENPLDDISRNTYIPILKGRNINVIFYTEFLKKISGDNQTATTNTQLQPFVVEAYDKDNNKLSGKNVRFYILHGEGDFGDGTSVDGSVTLDTITDADGRASATLTTGSTIGTHLITVIMQSASAESFRVTVTEEPSTPLFLKQRQESQQELRFSPQQEQQPAQEQQETQSEQQQEQPSPQQQQETQSQQQEQGNPSQEQEETQEQEIQQEQPPQQQEQPLVDESDTDTPLQQEQQPEQEQEETQEQEKTSQPPQQQEQPSQQQEHPLVDESDTDTPLQQEPSHQQSEPQQQEQENPSQQQPVKMNPQPKPEPNYTIIPFDYETEDVGKVVFSELMLTHLEKYPQWIELYNTTDQDIDMNGWKIVGRYLDDKNAINILESQVISKSFKIKSKETSLIVSFATPNSRDRISRGLVEKTYALGSNRKNLWNYEGLVLELQDAEGNPIDRFGNLNEEDEIVWEIPSVVREKRISLIRRLKSIRSQEYNFSFGIKEFGWFPAEKVKRLIENRNQYYYGRYTDIGSPGFRTEDGEPLPVTLSSFSSQLNKDRHIILKWITESEVDNAGFNILRSQSKQGPFVKVNTKLIQGAGTTGKRSSYTWTDTTAKPNVEYYYQIEDVSFAGKRQTLTTTRLKGLITAKNRFTTQWAQVKSSP